MGLKYNGQDNKRDGAKWGSTGGFCSSILLPPIVTRLMQRTDAFTQATLHPDIRRLTSEVRQQRDGELDFTSPAGHRLQVALRECRNQAGDLSARLELRMNGHTTFAGTLGIQRAFQRGEVTLAHCLIGAVELFYDHLAQVAALGEVETEMRVGVARIAGTISNAEVLRAALMGTIARNGKERFPGFDYEVVYGIFPDEGFNHFYGDGLVLQEGTAG